MKVTLAEEEWTALCDRSMDPVTKKERCYALPICCANVSALRDAIIELREANGDLLVVGKKRLLETYGWVKDCHSPDEWDWTILHKLMAQIDALSKNFEKEGRE